MILKLFSPLGTPLGASGSENSILNLIPVDFPSAPLECLTLKVVASLLPSATPATVAQMSAMTPHTASLRIASYPLLEVWLRAQPT